MPVQHLSVLNNVIFADLNDLILRHVRIDQITYFQFAIRKIEIS